MRPCGRSCHLNAPCFLILLAACCFLPKRPSADLKSRHVMQLKWGVASHCSLYLLFRGCDRWCEDVLHFNASTISCFCVQFTKTTLTLFLKSRCEFSRNSREVSRPLPLHRPVKDIFSYHCCRRGVFSQRGFQFFAPTH